MKPEFLRFIDAISHTKTRMLIAGNDPVQLCAARRIFEAQIQATHPIQKKLIWIEQTSDFETVLEALNSVDLFATPQWIEGIVKERKFNKTDERLLTELATTEGAYPLLLQCEQLEFSASQKAWFQAWQNQGAAFRFFDNENEREHWLRAYAHYFQMTFSKEASVQLTALSQQSAESVLQTLEKIRIIKGVNSETVKDLTDFETPLPETEVSDLLLAVCRGQHMRMNELCKSLQSQAAPAALVVFTFRNAFQYLYDLSLKSVAQNRWVEYKINRPTQLALDAWGRSRTPLHLNPFMANVTQLEVLAKQSDQTAFWHSLWDFCFKMMGGRGW